MSSATGEPLEVSTLVAYVPCSVSRPWLLCEWVHVAAERHGGASLGRLRLLRLLDRGLWGGRDTVLGKRLERPLGSELRVVVEGEDGRLV